MKTTILVLTILTGFSNLVCAQTELKGTITNDSVLTLTNSPYYLSGNLTIKNNATLTIGQGVVLDVKNHTINIGSGSAGKLTAGGATVKNSLSKEKYIVIKDGGKATISNCSFDFVYFEIKDDAGDTLAFESNEFENVSFPFISTLNKLPDITGDISSVSTIGIEGNLEEDAMLPLKGYTYTLSGNIYIKKNSTLQVEDGVTVDLNKYTLYSGSSTPGRIEAQEVFFNSSNSSEERIEFRDEGSGILSNCTFDNVYIAVEDDASDSINIVSNSFTDVSCPVEISVARSPVIEGNSCDVETIGLSGKLEEDNTLKKYQWDYKLTSSVSVKNNATLSFEENLHIDLNTHNFTMGSGTPGILDAQGVSFSNSKYSERALIFKDGSSGLVSGCSFDNVYIKIEYDASNDITIQGNQFTNSDFPIELSANRAPAISDNSSTNNFIGIGGDVTENNTLPKYDWDYILNSNVSVKNDATLTIANDVILDLSTKQLKVGVSTSDNAVLNADGVHFIGTENDRGKIYFYKNSGGILNNCRFEKSKIMCFEASPNFSNSRFYHCETALEILEGSSVVITSNDFYNNEISFLNSGSGTPDVSGNYWGHSSGPGHEDNSEGKGEVIEGDVTYSPFLEEPTTGTVTGSYTPTEINLGIVATGVQIDTSFTITNEGDIDFLIVGLKNHTSNLSVRCPDRFWILPGSSLSVPFSFTSLSDQEQVDTLTLLTNDNENPEFNITLSAIGKIDSLKINFFKVEIDSFPVVKVHFNVCDQAGIPITTILKENLSLAENDTTISEFDFFVKSGAATLVIDRSGSMSGQPLRDAKNAAIDLVNHLNEDDIASIVSFSSDVRTETPFTSEKSILIDAIENLTAHGFTAFYNALMESIDSIKYKPGNKVVVALTDGRNNTGNYSPSEIVAFALQYNVTIYCIGLGNDLNESAMRFIARSTGGQYFYAPESENLSVIYRIISGHLQNYYIRYLAPEDGLTLRTVELTANYHSFETTGLTTYSTEKQYIEFLSMAKPFYLDEFYKNTKSYIYFLVNDSTMPVKKGESLSFVQHTGSMYNFFDGKYLGDSIFQVGVELYDNYPSGSLKLAFPDSILYYGNYIGLKNKPADLYIPVKLQPLTESVDVYAEVSEEIKVLAGAAGAGPSIAAASMGVGATAGMGLNFEVNSEGTQYITRKFEAGVGCKVESPAINSVVGDVQAGVGLGISVKGMLGQTMEFTGNMNNDQKKAKTLYLLETFTLGAASLTPECFLLKTALHSSLTALSGGIGSAYEDMYYSESYGVGIDGKLSAGLSYALTPGEDQTKLELAEIGVGFALSGLFTNYMQENNNSMDLDFGYAVTGGFNLLNLKFGGLDLGSLYGYSAGADINLGANFDFSNGLNSLNLSFGLTENEQVCFNQTYKHKDFSFYIPDDVIKRALNNNLISSVAGFTDTTKTGKSLQISKDYFINCVNDFYTDATGPLDNIENHIIIETAQSEAICKEIGISVEAGVAVLAGAALQLGITLGYNEESSALEQTSTVVSGKLLPLANYYTPADTSLFSLTTEIKSLFKDVPDLVGNLIKSMYHKFQEAIETGVDFAAKTYDETCSIVGNFKDRADSTLTDVFLKIDSYNPASSFINWVNQKSAFIEPQIINGYSSKRVREYSDESQQSETSDKKWLCIVSDCYKINFYDMDGLLVEDFEPLTLKIALKEDMLYEYGFSDEEKLMAEIYYFNFDSLMWYEIPGDLHNSPDTVMAEIERSGTYAVGILYDQGSDTEAPEILNHYPGNGDTFNPDSLFYAKLFEPPLGSGVDVANSTLKIDGYEVDALWNPASNIISFRPTQPLSPGLHTFEIIASDYNGNQTNKLISFTVVETSSKNIPAENGVVIECFPNPANEFLNINLTNCNPQDNYQIKIYNSDGQVIKHLFEGEVDNNSLKIIWDISGYNHIRVSSGLYFLRIKTNDSVLIKKIIIN